MTTNVAVLVEGFAYLCFFDDGSWFQGTMLTEAKKQYGIMGESCDPPAEGYVECCFEDEPVFYTITVIDHDSNEEKVYKYAAKTGGDNCTLTSNEILFETEELLAGSKAENHVSKYCRPEVKGKHCIVCGGRLTIYSKEQSDCCI